MLEKISHFRIVREVGRGGMGVIYEAIDEQLGRRVAIKTLQLQGRRINRAALELFTTEARAAAQLTDPRVVQVYEAGEDQSIPYIAMEFVEGIDLADLLEKSATSQAGGSVEVTSNMTELVSVMLDRESASSAMHDMTMAGATPEPMQQTPAGTMARADETPAGAGMDVTMAQPDMEITPPGGLEVTPPGGTIATGESGSAGLALDLPATPPPAEEPAEEEEPAETPAGTPGPEAPAIRVARDRMVRTSEEYLRWASQQIKEAAEVLHLAHDLGVVHRDIKPHNLMITRSGQLKVADFGLAAMAATAVADTERKGKAVPMGTPAYMSPEQARCAPTIDGRTDVYSLGVTFYQLLTFKTPFQGKLKELMKKIQTEEPVRPRQLNPTIPEDLDTIILKAMAKHPDDRYRTSRELAEDIDRWLKHIPILAREIGPLGRFYRWIKRSPFRAFFVFALVIAIPIILYLFLFYEKYSERTEGMAREAMEAADPQNRYYAQAEAIFREADQARDAEDFENAYELYNRAREAFLKATHFDSAQEEAVTRARQAAVERGDHSGILARGEHLLGLAREARETGNYDQAYEHLGKALAVLEYDLAVARQANQARQGAVEHPLRSRAEELWQQGESILSRPELSPADLKEAEEIYREAGALFARCLAWDDALRLEALEKQKLADPNAPATAQGLQLIAEAEQARQAGEYQAAYDALRRAVGIFEANASAYDRTPELQATEMQQVGNRDSPLFEEGTRLLQQAQDAVKRGEFQEAYGLFRQARQRFRDSNPWDQPREDSVRRYRENARDDHPAYQRAEGLLQQAMSRKQDLAYEEAYDLLEQAQNLYYQARKYDPEKEERARLALEQANPIVEESYAIGQSKFQEAEGLRDQGDFAEAYAAFEEAWESLSKCQYVGNWEQEADAALAQADATHPSYLDYFQTLTEARRLKKTNGALAEQKFQTAAKQLGSIPRGTIVPGEFEVVRIKSRGERQAEDARWDARNIRNGVQDLKVERDDWASKREITHQTRPAYEEGIKIHARAEERWQAAEALLQQARDAYWQEKADEKARGLFEQARQVYEEVVPIYEQAKTELGKVSNRAR